MHHVHYLDPSYATMLVSVVLPSSSASTISQVRSQIMRLQVKSDGSVFDPAVQSSILDQIKQKLKENGMLENTTVTWKVQPDGNIFHKKRDDL
ncbi:hypothetical protein AMELA_G00271920 [Ameiurus melas]|uniref:Uncharacterized protein n=1 Tax=Ameiurus melas TaxID=219545 RepID=A0A7J5ZNZ1_AMEME|nr:hypothetical protein AMELA_G00271920 [Ameiurus melas]